MVLNVTERIGKGVMDVFLEFSRKELKSVHQLELEEFCHITDGGFRKTLAETFYGARWIYKLGLVLLVKDVEQMAHVRSQVIDYGSVCEGLLSDSLWHAIEFGHVSGKCYKTKNGGKIENWNVKDKLKKLNSKSFDWHIKVAMEEGVVDSDLAKKLDWLRNLRNTVHLRKRSTAHRAFLTTSKKAFEIVIETIDQTKRWKKSRQTTLVN